MSNISIEYKQDILLTDQLFNAVKKNDIQTIKTLFECGDLDPNITDNQRPLFFYAPTADMALLFTNNGVNVHATDAHGANVLQYLIDKNYPTDLIGLYLACDVNTRYKESCLLHLFCHQLPKKNFAKHIELAKILLTLMPNMINAIDSKGRTPLDIAQTHCPDKSSSDDETQSQDSSSGEDERQYCKALCELLKSLGSKTSQELAQQAMTKKNNLRNTQNNNTAKHKNETPENTQTEDTDDCKCTIS